MFHVPERYRLTDHPTLGSDWTAGQNGAFRLESPEPGWELWLICSDGNGDDRANVPAAAREWEHVSVQAVRGQRSRVPTWREMAFVKDRCWDAEDVVMQLHPARSEYVNLHPHVLHLWRPKHCAIPTPPTICVGPLPATMERI